MVASDTTAIAEAIRQILQGYKADVPVVAYRNADTLSALWGLSGSLAKGPMVLMDDDRESPLMPDRMGAHLSALDWALLRGAADGVEATGPIVVLDLRKHLRTRDFDTDRSYLSKHVHYHAPSRFGLDELQGFIKSLGQLDPVPPCDKGAAIRWRTRWLASLALADTRAGHHEMNNSLAPLLLALGNTDLEEQVVRRTEEASVQVTGDPASFTRRVMLKALALASQEKPKGLRRASWSPPTHCGEIRFLLLDDQVHEGWVSIITRMLGLRKPEHPRSSGAFTEAGSGSGVSLWVGTDASQVLAQVWPEPGFPPGSGRGRWAAGRRLKLTAAPESGEPWSEVLLLDLRLYARSPHAESTFLQSVATAYAAATGQAPAWLQYLTNPDFQNGTNYLEALTCFARLICEVDFTYPVVIWSSTSQRRVTEALKAYPNIYTAIEKPRLDAYISSPEELQASFLAAMHAVLQWISRLVQAAHFTGVLLEDRPVFKIPADKKHVEIYIDESSISGEPGFQVGALIVYYDSVEVADDLQDRLGANYYFDSVKFFKSRENGSSFSGSDPNPAVIDNAGIVFTGPYRLPKKLDFGKSFGSSGYAMIGETPYEKPKEVRKLVADALAGELKEAATAIFLRVRSSEQQVDYEIDGRYPTVLSECLKLVFTLFVRGRDRSASVYIATKQSTVDARERAVEIFHRFGPLSRVEKSDSSNSDIYYYDAMTNHSAFLPVIDAHQFARGRDGRECSKLLFARGVTLSYKEAPPRGAHYEWQLLLDAGGNQDVRLKSARPVASAKLTRAWRHMHYFADELLEPGARGIYEKAGALHGEGDFFYDLHPQHAPTPKTFADIGRALVWDDFEEAAKLFFTDVLWPQRKGKSEPTPLECFVGGQLRARAHDRGIATRMWISVLNCIAGVHGPGGTAPANRPPEAVGLQSAAVPKTVVAQELVPLTEPASLTTSGLQAVTTLDARTEVESVARLVLAKEPEPLMGPEQVAEPELVLDRETVVEPKVAAEPAGLPNPNDVVIGPFDEGRNAATRREILNSICLVGWTGRPIVEAGSLRFPGARRYFDLISRLLPPDMQAR